MAPNPIENWDDDGDFQGDLFTHSVASSVAHTAFSLSSRAPSVRSESVNDEDDWQLLIKPNDDASTRNAISQAKHAGIPLPNSTPSSALLGGTIKRLGKTPSRQKITDEDWGDDLELPAPSSDGLKLKTLQPPPLTPSQDDDDFDDWAEGSLGIRFAGTRRDHRTRGSSVSAAMSPSLGSCMTLESEDDDFGGLVLPTEPLDFKAILLRRQEAEADEDKTPQPDPRPLADTSTDVGHLHSETSASLAPTPSEQSEAQPSSELFDRPAKAQLDLQPTYPPEQSVEPQKQAPIVSRANEEDDFFADVDFDTLDAHRNTVNRHVRVQSKKSRASSARNSGPSLTFTDKTAPSSRIPRPLPSISSRSRLDPVPESGAPQPYRNDRLGPPSASSHLLRSKRSAPVLRSEYRSSRNSAPFLPSGVTSKQSQPSTSRPTPSHLRRESDHRSHSPTPRAHSRLSRGPDTPRRGGNRKDIAPASLVQEARTKRQYTKPTRKRNFGDGSELDLFDDLPTSDQKESGFLKKPSNRAPNKSLRQVSHSKLPQPPERMNTPQPPPTPSRKVKRESLPSFARDTAASRIAREQRLGGPRSRHEGSLAPVSTNWKTQVAARTPQTSPQANRKRGTGQKPTLIKHINDSVSRTEKGMTYNPSLNRWDGNDSALAHFSATIETINQRHVSGHAHSVSQPQITLHRHNNSIPSLPTPTSLTAKTGSPPRPALIAPVGAAQGVQVERGMVFDPRRMCWLKLDARASGPFSPTPSIGDDDDPFADIDDLKDDEDKVEAGAGALSAGAGGPGPASTAMDNFISEEFDLGPAFIHLQHGEEGNWRRRVEKWVGPERDAQTDDWRWDIRCMSASASASSFAETIGPR